ncbi:conserved archael hypothetical protein [Methanococcus vannielii SB]|uniref:Uncharacterized protein n=1 Tax=Methanococcus vannielii (strain ATCC 35089 / DSM 1224 / JCM 13029 / OCM 148 / SB) TaxID=406327 RepID=A6US33_METVS|nr:hypothetical protein [Methanococcus vannielii]ABR55305.1 conserved archael hypothetical protein [Methanococcus vannielii SB]
MENERNFENENIDIIEIPLPPGIPQSVIGRLSCINGIGYEIRKNEMMDKEYPVITGTKEQIDYVKEYMALFTELKLALRDISRLARRFKTEVKLYCEEEELRYILSFAVSDVSGKERFFVLDEKPEGEYEKIVILDKEIFVYI